MKMLRFILHVLKHGSFFNKPVDFHAAEQQHLKEIENEKSIHQNIAAKVAPKRFIGNIIGNIAYLKSTARQHQNIFLVHSAHLGYVRILKSGSTSVLREILPLMDTSLKNKDLNDKQLDLLANRYVSGGVTPANYELFTIVRNPFQRLVSVYLDLFNPQNEHFGYQTYLFGIFKRDMSFHDFVRTITIIPDQLRSGHLASQLDIIDQCGGVGKIKHYRLEEDKESLQKFLASKGIKLQHRNKNASPYDYRTYYTRDTLALAYRIYEKDIVAFDYQKSYKILADYLNG